MKTTTPLRETYDGFCRGGPWDGKLYAHTKPLFTVITERTHFNLADEQGAREGPKQQHYSGEYRFVAGQWIWHPHTAT